MLYSFCQKVETVPYMDHFDCTETSKGNIHHAVYHATKLCDRRLKPGYCAELSVFERSIEGGAPKNLEGMEVEKYVTLYK